MGDVIAAYEARLAGGALSADPAQRSVAERLDALAEELAEPARAGWFQRRTSPRGLYIWGPVGRGKSMLMDLFFALAPEKRKIRTHFHEFMLARHAFMAVERAKGDLGPDQLIARTAKEIAGEARLICFDELAVTDIADAMLLGRLFERLFAADIVVVATSNRAPDDLYKNGLNRQLFLPFIDLIKARLDVVELAAERDYRLERLMAAPVYYAPLGPAASARVDEAWARLTFDAEPKPVTLDVNGRALLAPRQAAGVARFTFDELCARPLGAGDYLELAERFHTLIVENVPKLTPAKREEAARFRILIDTLYEAKTKLILAAEAEPQALYPEGDQSFEFERTVSRLMEMRSADYLALPRRDAEWKRGLIE